MQENGFLKLLDYALALRVVCFFQVARYVVHALSVGYRHHDALVAVALRLEDVFDYRPSYGLYAVSLALEVGHCHLERFFGKVVMALVCKLFKRERAFHSQHFQELVLAAFIVVLVDYLDHTVPNDVGNVHSDALAHQCVTAFLVHYGALLVHHVVIFEQALTYAEVVFLNLPLSTFDVLCNQRTFNPVSFLEAETVHHACNSFACEQTHQLVFKADVEHRAARVALTACTSAQLAVYAAAFMAFGAYDCQTSGCLYFGRELDVGTTTGHVRSYCYCSEQSLFSVCRSVSVGYCYRARCALACLGNDVCLLLVQLRIKHIVRNVAHLEHLA